MNYVTTCTQEQFETLMRLLPNRPVEYPGPCVVIFHVNSQNALQHFEVVEQEIFSAAYWIVCYDTFMARRLPS